MKRIMHNLMEHVLPIQYRGDTRQPILYLTFDDGPTPNTPQVLDVLDRHGVTATFFIVGERIAGNEAILAEIARAGHVIGNHSFAHRPVRELSRLEIDRDLNRCNQAIQAVVKDWRPRLIRPPYGRLSLDLFGLAVTRQLRISMWSKDAIDYRAKTPADIDASLGKITNGDILLFHDEFPVTAAALDVLIHRYLDNGYRFAAL